MKRVTSAVVVLSFCLSSAAFGQVRAWVSPNGMDSNPCTLAEPCRTFGAGVNIVDLGGEVVALQSGGYGAVTISKSVTIVSPQGVHAAVSPTSGTAVLVSAGATDKVVVRNLYLNSQGASIGIQATSGKILYVEHCVVNGFTGGGIRFNSASASPSLYVSETTVRHSYSGRGIEITGSGTHAALDSVRVYDSNGGIFVDSAIAAIRDSLVAQGNGNAGFWAFGGARVGIENSVAVNNGFGFDATAGGRMTITRCEAIGNGHGIYSFGTGSLVWVSDTTITANTTGVGFSAPAIIHTLGNNTLQGNDTNGAFTTPFSGN